MRHFVLRGICERTAENVFALSGSTKSIGHALYMLHAAIKALTERGPVDAVTGDARYSLSEEKLLKETVDAEPLVRKLQSKAINRTFLCSFCT